MVPMPAVIVLILCKTVVVGPPDQNAHYTHSQNLDWATENSMMVCRRQEVFVQDMDEGKNGADPQPFTPGRCQRSAMLLGPQWDMQHPNSKYRFWRVACPSPQRQDLTGNGPSPDDPIIGWVLPDCGHRDTVICEQDTSI